MNINLATRVTVLHHFSASNVTVSDSAHIVYQLAATQPEHF